MKKNKPVVSVCMVTYNHSKFIVEAIEGVLKQETNFTIELVISEDCGPDNTREICIKYKEQYPDIIKLLLPETNLGMMPNFKYTLENCEGKYIALCEGDDYWTDPLKLQKQVDFLEKNQDYTLLGHNAAVLCHNGEIIYNTPNFKSPLTTFDLIKEDWGIMTASMIFRKHDFVIPKWFMKIGNGDYAMQLQLSTKGKIGYLPDFMSIYRRHEGGISQTYNPYISSYNLYILFKYFNQDTKSVYKKQLDEKRDSFYRSTIQLAKQHGLVKQKLGLQLIYFTFKLGIDIFPIMEKLRLLTRR